MSRTRSSARDSGSIRKVTRKSNGKSYTYCQAKYTEGYDPGTGKQIQKTSCGKTQKEVARRLRKITYELDDGTYVKPCKLLVSEWLDIWVRDYTASVKPRTVDSYRTTVDLHLKPAFGATRLDELKTPIIQNFYNALQAPTKQRSSLSAKTIKNSRCTAQSITAGHGLGYIKNNPANACKLPKIVKPEIQPLDDDGIKSFIHACKGHRFEYLYLVTLFSGIGKGEVLELTWNCINFQKNMITIDKQLQKERRGNGDDIKTLQENLGHYTATFTLETYALATAQMKTENADRMERFIHNLGA